MIKVFFHKNALRIIFSSLLISALIFPLLKADPPPPVLLQESILTRLILLQTCQSNGQHDPNFLKTTLKEGGTIQKFGTIWSILPKKSNTQSLIKGPYKIVSSGKEAGPFRFELENLSDFKINLIVKNAVSNRVICEIPYNMTEEAILEHLTISPDGTYFLFFEAIEYGDTPAYYIHQVTSDGNIRPLCEDPLPYAEISPDSQSIFTLNGEFFEIVNVASWTRKKLSEKISYITEPFGWSEDSKKIGVLEWDMSDTYEDPTWTKKWLLELQ